MGYKGKRWKVKGAKRGRETVNKRERGSVRGGSKKAGRMKTGQKKQQKKALMHFYTHCQGPLLIQTRRGNENHTHKHTFTHIVKKDTCL